MQDEFVQQVKDLLDHLYDYEFIQNSSLADALDPAGHLLPRERMRLLRSALLSSLEELAPRPTVSPYSPRVRSYNVLSLHYVDRLTVQQVAIELSLSDRQVYRDLRQAEQDLAEVVWAHLQRLGAEHSSGGEASRLDLALRELSRVPEEYRSLDVCALLRGAIAAVKKLAHQRGVEITIWATTDLGTIHGAHHAVRQALVGVLSYVAQQAIPGTEISVSGEPGTGQVSLEISYLPDAMELGLPEVTAGLIKRQGGAWDFAPSENDRIVLRLSLSNQRSYHVLVIDDNEGLVALFQRYVTGEQYWVTGARDGQDGLRQAETMAPDLIVLDVLMPGQDGWEILQALRESESTRDIPVIVCSVLDNPALAYSLGASGFLSKPVSRQHLVNELMRCCPAFPPG